MADEITINRDYIDDTSVKEYVTDTDNGLIAKYFQDVDVSLRNVGTVGYTTELVSNISQDTFNAASVLFRETFVNRAYIPESIYSHAALFQIDDVFSTAAQCTFLIVMEEQAILDNMKDTRETSVDHFFIGKNTTIYVEDVPYCLDYDVRVNVARLASKNSSVNDNYIFTATYVATAENSISNVSSPYITVRRSSDGFIALEVSCHQCTRDVRTETILTNTELNYQVIDVDFDGKLAGFDVRYKPPESTADFTDPLDTTYGTNKISWFTTDDTADSDLISNPDEEEDTYKTNTGIQQMDTLIVYSEPLTTPFCYYQFLDEDTLRITFNTKDRFFMPEFNSEIEITLYITEGIDGNFDTYTGDNISAVVDEDSVQYDESFLTAARPVGASADGMDQLSIEGLQSLAAEGYRTANALTTDNDLQEYFNNYKYRFGDATVLFMKKRNDVYERVYSAYEIIRNEDYIYKTNTLNIFMNLYEWEHPDTNVFILKPGHLFTINSNDGFCQYLRDSKSTTYYNEYQRELSLRENGDAFFFDSNTYKEIAKEGAEIPSYYNRAASFAQWKQRRGYDDRLMIYDVIRSITTQDKVDDTNIKYRFKPEYENLDNAPDNKFLVMNPFLLQFTKTPNLVTTYLTYVHNDCLVDFINEDESSYVQYVLAEVHVNREFEKEERYHIYATISPSVNMSLDHYPIALKKTTINDTTISDTDEDVTQINSSTNSDELETVRYTFTPVTEHTKYRLSDSSDKKINNDLRVMCVIAKNNKNYCYTEMYPTNINTETGGITFDCWMYTTDFVTSNSELEILNKSVYLDNEGYYYAVDPYDATIYYKYSQDTDECVYSSGTTKYTIPYSSEDENTVTIMKLLKENKIRPYSNTHNMVPNNSKIAIPLDDVSVRIYTLYDRHFENVIDSTGNVVGGELKYNDKTGENSSEFASYDSSLLGYKVTNEYHTDTHPVTFMKPLDNIRSALIFKDYTQHHKLEDNTDAFDYDVFDCDVYSINFIRASEYFNTETFIKFLNKFTDVYEHLDLVMEQRLRNATDIDCKLYNTYGRSKNFYIGDEEELMDTVNLRIRLDVWFVHGTDTQMAVPEVKRYIKQEVETVNARGTNTLYVSNLMRKIENKFAYVDHIRFRGINDFDSKYQAVKNKVVDIDDLTVEDRRFYVPELLTIDLENIIITEYYADEIKTSY